MVREPPLESVSSRFPEASLFCSPNRALSPRVLLFGFCAQHSPQLSRNDTGPKRASRTQHGVFASPKPGDVRITSKPPPCLSGSILSAPQPGPDVWHEEEGRGRRVSEPPLCRFHRLASLSPALSFSSAGPGHKSSPSWACTWGTRVTCFGSSARNRSITFPLDANCAVFRGSAAQESDAGP